MGIYKFKLQNLLELKESIENDKRNEFGSAVQRLSKEKDALNVFIKDLSETLQKLNAERKTGISVAKLRELYYSQEYYRTVVDKQNIIVKMAEENVEECRKNLIEAAKEKKIMEKLKEKDFERFSYAEQKKEDRIVDELISFKQSIK